MKKTFFFTFMFAVSILLCGCGLNQTDSSVLNSDKHCDKVSIHPDIAYKKLLDMIIFNDDGINVYPENLGGWYFDADGRFHVLYTISDNSLFSEITSCPDCVIFDKVDYSLNYLQELFYNIELPDSIVILSKNIDYRENCIMFQVDDFGDEKVALYNEISSDLPIKFVKPIEIILD